MDLKNISDTKIGVVGAGSFGIVMANLLAENSHVLLYARRPEVADKLRNEGQVGERRIHERVSVTSDLAEVAGACEVIFPVVPSEHFRSMIRDLAPFLLPSHRLIHGTKGLDVHLAEGETIHTVKKLNREQVRTMSEVIREETCVMRVGCVAGPNLAGEIAEGQPAAAVVASRFEEVIREGQAALRSSRFRVHSNYNLFTVELAGVLKNIMAIASGILSGLNYGENTRALLITRGLAEMIHIGKKLGADVQAFMGLAGIGDLVATCYSRRSRNFTVGYRLAQGESLDQILASMDEVAEGVKTVAIIRALIEEQRISAPITLSLYKTLFEGMDISKGMRLLMEYPFSEDVEFM
ncbi:MAG: NAD(P)-dependent glycerol-3-phosphate dehydrogenase [Bacteroidetes bacterium]|nr:MAG: NAD(P)-dependent glycerol-3-phosphate dehydrogenase [Bacteroidota bacterium]